jgi:hypothetical protein
VLLLWSAYSLEVERSTVEQPCGGTLSGPRSFLVDRRQSAVSRGGKRRWPEVFSEQLINDDELIQRWPQQTSSRSPSSRTTEDPAQWPQQNFFPEPSVKDDGGSGMVVPFSYEKGKSRHFT